MRRPAVLFGAAFLVLTFAIGLIGVTLSAGGFRGFDADAAAGLAVPVGAASALTWTEVWSRLRRGRLPHLLSVAIRGAVAFAAIGFAWPVAIGVSAAMAGVENALAAHLQAALLGAAVGAPCGAIAAAAAGLASLNRAEPTRQA
jgi:hypothetical protein